MKTVTHAHNYVTAGHKRLRNLLGAAGHSAAVEPDYHGTVGEPLYVGYVHIAHFTDIFISACPVRDVFVNDILILLLGKSAYCGCQHKED